jgi:hypothetical protein
MRQSLWAKSAKLAAIAAALVFSFLQVPNAKATEVFYTFTSTSTGQFAGTTFTYDSTGGYLNVGGDFVPASPVTTDLIDEVVTTAQ